MEGGGAPRPNVDIAIDTWDGSTRREYVATTIDEFVEKTAELELSSVVSIEIWAWLPRGNTASEDESVFVAFDRNRQPPVTAAIDAPADYEQFVIAADELLARAIEIRERRRPDFDRFINATSVTLGIASAVISAAVNEDQTAWKVVAVSLAVFGGSAWLLRRIARWLFPPFELLPEGDRARTLRILQRAKRGLLAAWPLWGAFLGSLAALLIVRALG